MMSCVFPIQAKIGNSFTEDAFADLKQCEYMDFESFVSLMGRRDAAQPISELSVLQFSHNLIRHPLHDFIEVKEI